MFVLLEPRFGASARSLGAAADPVKGSKCANHCIHESVHFKLQFYIESTKVYLGYTL